MNLRVDVYVRFSSHVDETDTEYHKVSSIVDEIRYDSRLQLPQDSELACCRVRLHQRQHEPVSNRQMSVKVTAR